MGTDQSGPSWLLSNSGVSVGSVSTLIALNGPGERVPIPPEQPPPFAQFMLALAPHVQWLACRLACSQQLLLRHLHLLVSRLFSTAEDWRLLSAMEVWVASLDELSEQVWESLLHLTTCPIPVHAYGPGPCGQGAGQIGCILDP